MYFIELQDGDLKLISHSKLSVKMSLSLSSIHVKFAPEILRRNCDCKASADSSENFEESKDDSNDSTKQDGTLWFPIKIVMDNLRHRLLFFETDSQRKIAM